MLHESNFNAAPKIKPDALGGKKEAELGLIERSLSHFRAQLAGASGLARKTIESLIARLEKDRKKLLEDIAQLAVVHK